MNTDKKIGRTGFPACPDSLERLSYLSAVIAVLLLATQFCLAGEEAPKGPRVEVKPGDGGQAYTCVLLGFKDGVLDLQRDDGEVRHEKASGMESVHFLPPPEAPAPAATPASAAATPTPAAPPNPGGKHAEAAGKWAGWNPEDGRRLRELEKLEMQGALHPAEKEELRNLRERAPQILLRMEKTRRKVHAGGGKVDVAEAQRHLRDATQGEDAEETLFLLFFGYQQQGYTGQKLEELLRKDAESIVNPVVRAKAVEYLRPLLNFIETRKPLRKDK
ncbi:MAG: hypothetical protein ABSE73_04990 [Planctomycetota bacterium]